MPLQGNFYGINVSKLHRPALSGYFQQVFCQLFEIPLPDVPLALCILGTWTRAVCECWYDLEGVM